MILQFFAHLFAAMPPEAQQPAAVAASHLLDFPLAVPMHDLPQHLGAIEEALSVGAGPLAQLLARPQRSTPQTDTQWPSGVPPILQQLALAPVPPILQQSTPPPVPLNPPQPAPPIDLAGLREPGTVTMEVTSSPQQLHAAMHSQSAVQSMRARDGGSSAARRGGELL